VYGIDNLGIADGPIMPRIATGNAMAPCVVVGERAADLLKATHGLSGVRNLRKSIPISLKR
jgi:choline dehydrogenase